jgi:hypothetical protein
MQCDSALSAPDPRRGILSVGAPPQPSPQQSPSPIPRSAAREPFARANRAEAPRTITRPNWDFSSIGDPARTPVGDPSVVPPKNSVETTED